MPPRFSDSAQLADALVDVADDLFRVSGVTVSRGGPCWPGFLLMREPYRGPYGDLTTGRSFVSAEKAARASMREHVEAMVAFWNAGVPTLDYGNNIRQVARDEGFDNAFAFPGWSPSDIAFSACSKNVRAASIAIFINCSGLAPTASMDR